MFLELNPEQQRILDIASQSGMSPEEVLDQAFAIIREQYRNEGWMLEERNAIGVHIAEGFRQAESGELVEADEAIRILKERRAKRQIV